MFIDKTYNEIWFWIDGEKFIDLLELGLLWIGSKTLILLLGSASEIETK